MLTKRTAIAEGRARRVLVAPLREINLPPVRLLNKLSNGVSHMQINATVSET